MDSLGGANSNALAVGDEVLLAHWNPQGTTIIRWSGSAWVPVGDTFADRVTALTVHGKDIIAAGHFPGSIARFPVDGLDD
jgi:hypothetical protein